LPTKPRKRRRRGPVEFQGERKSKLPFPVNLLFNVKAFYFLFIVVMIVSMAAVGLGVTQGSQNPPPPPIIDITPTPQVSAAAKIFASTAPVIDASQPYVATLKTNKGDISIKLATDTPQTVNSFAFLAAKGYYDNSAFFYIERQYWAQGGDSGCLSDGTTTCTGTGDAGYKIPVETTSAKHVKWAVVAPLVQGTQDVSGGQFRILFTDDPRLDGTETIFGTVVAGQAILEQQPDLRLCSALTQIVTGCDKDLSNALIIQHVVVAPAS
jgi:Peptidyl-prolyl cis-trans isomerase (rotamase) - cyclophilin family